MNDQINKTSREYRTELYFIYIALMFVFCVFFLTGFRDLGIIKPMRFTVKDYEEEIYRAYDAYIIIDKYEVIDTWHDEGQYHYYHVRLENGDIISVKIKDDLINNNNLLKGNPRYFTDDEIRWERSSLINDKEKSVLLDDGFYKIMFCVDHKQVYYTIKGIILIILGCFFGILLIIVIKRYHELVKIEKNTDTLS